MKIQTIVYLLPSAPAPPRKTRGELMKNIDADYYGYRDEDDGVLVPLEKEAQKEGMNAVLLYFWKVFCSLECVGALNLFSVALAKALEDYEKRKAAGEIPQVEEEDIYAAAAETAVCIIMQYFLMYIVLSFSSI
jgi:hypothetical protein